MGDAGSPRPIRRRRLAALVLVLALPLVPAASAPAQADLRPPARMRGEPPMRFVRVVSADPACAPDCPEWLSAEGRIETGTARDLGRALDALNGRRLPILIHSPGGSVPDAIAMGELIRSEGLAVAVARTLIANCPERAPRCPGGTGRAITGGAKCASACVLALAGGVERLAGPAARIGVHQMTTVVKETKGAAGLVSTRKFYEQLDVDAVVSAYLAEMGVGDPVMELTRKTPAASVRWLSLADLKASHLATLALDADEPILSSGLNGLNGRALDGDPPRAGLIQASLVAPAAEGGAPPRIALRYRRGGGAVEAAMTADDGESQQASASPSAGWSLTLTAPGAAPLRLSTAGTAPTRALIARERFCALAAGGKLVVEPIGGAPTVTEAPQPSTAVAAMAGVKALIAEACP